MLYCMGKSNATETWHIPLQRSIAILKTNLHIMLPHGLQQLSQNHQKHKVDEMCQFNITSLSDLPQLPDSVTHWWTSQRPYTTRLLTHRQQQGNGFVRDGQQKLDRRWLQQSQSQPLKHPSYWCATRTKTRTPIYIKLNIVIFTKHAHASTNVTKHAVA